MTERHAPPPRHGRHPHFDDGAAVKWFTRLRDALAAARAEKKKVFIEYGRQACASCRTLVENIIPQKEISEVLSRSYIALAIDCDLPDPVIRHLGATHMPHARMLPFLLYIDENGHFLDGTQGRVAAPDLLAQLERIAAR